MNQATLYIVATPIGNLQDITLRALEVLKSVDVIFAEDTRVSRKLLDRYEISKPLHSYREAAERGAVERTIREICSRLERGESVAYVSDAGTPGISDPGGYLVERVIASGYSVVPVPGATALGCLVSVAGRAVARPLFVGFIPKKKGHQTLLQGLKSGLGQDLCDSIVFYESPERIVKLLQELQGWELPLYVCLGRELTKQFEEVLRGPLEDVLLDLQKRASIKGEIALLIMKQS